MNNQTSQAIKLLCAVCLSAMFLLNCKKEKKNSEELITSVELHDHDGNKEYKWEDLEGDGNPTIDTVRLKAGTPVEFELHFYAKTGGTQSEITGEIRSEGTEHQVFYVSASSSLQMTVTDKDANQKPLGLACTWSPMSKGQASVRITLKHEPNKSATDPSATGDTDIEVTFPVVVE
jgi:hypothetical protein